MIEKINVSLKEVLEVLGSPFMLENKAFWTLTETHANQMLFIPDYVSFFKEASTILKTNALLMRGLEERSDTFREYCTMLGAVDCNVIISPKGASLFDYHVDPNDVWVKMLYGRRDYWINGRSTYELVAGQSIFIQKGDIHKVTAAEDSISISFGIPFNNKKTMSPKKVNGAEAFNFSDMFKALPIFKQWSSV